MMHGVSSVEHLSSDGRISRNYLHRSLPFLPNIYALDDDNWYEFFSISSF